VTKKTTGLNSPREEIIEEEMVPPIRIIHNELMKLIDPKYMIIKKKIKELLEEDKKAITLNATQV
jgi:hypothetical protein